MRKGGSPELERKQKLNELSKRRSQLKNNLDAGNYMSQKKKREKEVELRQVEKRMDHLSNLLREVM